MNFSVDTLIAIGIQIVLMAVGWGDLRRQAAHNKERTDEYHRENREALKEIRDDVKRINGSTTRHEALLSEHTSDIKRLEGRRRR